MNLDCNINYKGDVMHNAHSHSAMKRTVSRRAAIGLMGFGAATAVLTPFVLNARQAQRQTSQPTPNQSSQLIMKEIPRTKEKVPAIGMGTFMTFDILPGQPRDRLREVMQRFWDGGGRVIDTSSLYGMGEIVVGDCATALGITDNLFVTDKVWSTGEYLSDDSLARRQFEQSMQRLWRNRIDVIQVHSLVNVDVILPILREWKQEGRVRYVGVTHHELPYLEPLTKWVENGDLDFVQFQYSIHARQAEERLLPAAIDRGTAVLANMPFSKARLFKVVEGQQLPDFAREIGCENWAQFFLKYVISHPAVICAIPATSNPDHASQNIGALRGPLPDREMRTRMEQHMASLPGFDKLATMDPYPGKRFSGAVRLGPRNPRNARNS